MAYHEAPADLMQHAGPLVASTADIENGELNTRARAVPKFILCIAVLVMALAGAICAALEGMRLGYGKPEDVQRHLQATEVTIPQLQLGCAGHFWYKEFGTAMPPAAVAEVVVADESNNKVSRNLRGTETESDEVMGSPPVIWTAEHGSKSSNPIPHTTETAKSIAAELKDRLFGPNASSSLDALTQQMLVLFLNLLTLAAYAGAAAYFAYSPLRALTAWPWVSYFDAVLLTLNLLEASTYAISMMLSGPGSQWAMISPELIAPWLFVLGGRAQGLWVVLYLPSYAVKRCSGARAGSVRAASTTAVGVLGAHFTEVVSVVLLMIPCALGTLLGKATS